MNVKFCTNALPVINDRSQNRICVTQRMTFIEDKEGRFIQDSMLTSLNQCSILIHMIITHLGFRS